MSIERFEDDGLLLALVIRASYTAGGIEFFTDQDSSQQLGYMNRPAGYQVAPHHHKLVHRNVKATQEVLLVRRGSCRLDLYGTGHEVVRNAVLLAGDVVLLASGGHGLVMLEQTEIIEIKQGPYAGDQDKVRFEPVGETK